MRLPSSDIRRILALALLAGLGLGTLIYGFVRLVEGAPPVSLARGLPVALLIGLLVGLAFCVAVKLALRQAAYDLHNHAVALTETQLPLPVPIGGDEVVYMRETLSQALAYVPRPEDLPFLARELGAASGAQGALVAAAECIARHLPIDGATLLVLDGELSALTPVAAWGTAHLPPALTLDLETTSLGRALIERRLTTYSGHQVRTILPLQPGPATITLFCLPQIVNGQPFGTLCLLAPGEDVRLSEEQREFAQAAADLLILGVQSSIHRRLLERETQRLIAFEQLGSLLAGSARLDRALEQVLRVAARVTSSEHGSLLLLEPDERSVRYRVTLKQGDVLPLNVTVGPILRHGLAGWALRERRADIIEDTERDSRWLPVPGLGDMRSVLVVPLLYGERALGVLTLADPTPRHYSRRSLAITTALAAYAVTILARDQYEEVVAPGSVALARRLFEDHVAPAGLSELIADSAALDRTLSPRSREVVALFVGVRGLDRHAEHLPAEQLIAEVLTPFSNELAAVVYEQQGYLAQRDDGGALVLFGYPLGQADVRAAALRAGQGVLGLARRLRGRWRARFGLDLGLSAGMAAGQLVAGVVGGENYHDLALLGPVIREATRLQRLARTDEILITDALAASPGAESVQPLAPLANDDPETTRSIYRLLAGRG
ncbi:MAG: GAF domain-containing protein [Chloroflexi bacterium OHK40]